MGLSYYDNYDGDKNPYKCFEDWLILNKESLNQNILDLIQKSFLDGFEAGRKRRDEENWELWNQK